MKEKKQKNITSVGFVALGCPKNIVDSEKMLANIGCLGFLLSSDHSNCDVVVINTCGFIAPAKEEAIEYIQQALVQKKKGNIKKVIVAGCLAQRIGPELIEQFPDIDAIVGLHQRQQIGQVIKTVTGSKNRQTSKLYLDKIHDNVFDDSEKLLLTPGHWTYLRISEGCNRKCSFCTIPSIRGPFKSKDEDIILKEARELTDNGAVELVIIAQDSNYYGKDKGISDGLSKLIKKLEQIEKLRWIRLMYLYPATITDKLIETIAQSDKVVNYIDMPIQHINDDILMNMQRIDSKDKTIALVEKLKKRIPDVVLRTTIITGFPGETDSQFEELLDFVNWAKFDALGCFTFYPEEGTPAAEMPNQVSQETKEDRARQLMLLQQEIAFAKAEKLIGSDLICLVDELYNQSIGLGRYYGQAPQVDSLCIIKKCKAPTGSFIRAKIQSRQDYDLIVKQEKLLK